MPQVPTGSGRDLRRLPKANLHLHLTGSMRPATLVELADRHGLPLPEPLPDGTVSDWSAFQDRYDLARAVLRTADDLRRVVAEAAEDTAADGGTWLEIQVDPTTYAARLGGLEPVVEAVLAGAAGGRTGVILAASWGGSPEQALRVARLAARYADRGVVGFGLSGDERQGRIADVVPAARVAARAGLLVVPHSGFYTPARHVRDCVTRLGAHRIGHGLAAAGDPATLDLLAGRAVTLEVCPSSYPPLGITADLAATPLRTLLAAGVPVALGTDDPLLFGAGLLDQYTLARDVLGCTDTELATLATHSVEASAAPPALRARMRTGVAEWLCGMDQDSGSVCYIGAPFARPRPGVPR
jgi:adenosine deaminase